MAGFGIPRRLPVEDIPEIVLSDSSDKSDGDLPVPSESSNDKKPIQSESSQVKNSGVKHSHPVHGPLSFPPAQVKSEEQALPEVKAKNVDSPVTELVTRPPIAVPPSTATPQPAATIPVTTMSATAPVTRIVSAIGSDVRTRPDQDPRLQRHRDPLASSTCAVVRTTNSYTSPVTLLVPPANISCSVSGKPLLQASGFRAPGGTSRLPSAVIPSSQTRLPSANFSRETSLLPTPSAAGVAISGTNLPMLSGPARLASFKNTMASFQGMKTAVATTVKTKAVSRPAPREFVIGPQSQILPVMPASPKLQGTLSSPLSHVTQSAVFTSSKATSHKHSAGTQVAKTGSSLPDGKPAAATKGKESRSQGSFQRLSLKTKNHVRPKMKIKVSSTVTSPSTLSGSPGANISPSQALADNGPAATSANTSPGQEIRVKPVSGATKVTKLQAVTSPVAGVLSKSKASPQHRENRLPAGSPKSTPDRRSAGRSRKGLLVFACAWKDCDYQFEDRDSLVKHLTAAQPGCHFADALEAKDTTCYWKGCTKNSDKSPKMSTLSLKMHLGQHEATAAIFISEEEVSRNFIPVNPNKGQTAEQESPFAAVYDEHVEAAVKEQAAKGKQQNNNKKKPVSARKESGRTGSAGKHDAKESTSQVPSTMLRKVQRDEKILLPEGWMDKDSNAGKVLIPTNGNDLQLPEPSVSTSSSSVSNVSASSKLSPARPILSTGSANVVQRSPAGQSNAATANKDGILTSESASEHKSDNIHTAIAGQVKAKSSGHDSLITNTTGLAGEGPGDVPDRTGQNRTHTSQDLAQLSPTAASTTASLAKVDPDIPSGPVNLLHSPEVSDSGTAADANMADEDLPEPMDVEHQHTRLMPATVVSIEHAYSNLELPPPEKPEKVEMVEVAKKGKEGQLPPTIKLVEICEDVRVPSASLVTTKLATKARCAYCHVEKYVSQMKRVEASTLVNTSWGHRGICFCRQRCRYNFISAYPQVEFLNLSFSDLLDGGIRENAPKLPRNISHMVQNTGNSSAVDKFTYKPAPEEAKGMRVQAVKFIMVS